jgi:hypothetical protein
MMKKKKKKNPLMMRRIETRSDMTGAAVVHV